MFRQRQQVTPLQPELVVYIYNGQYTALANGNNSAIPPIRPPPGDTLIKDVLNILNINNTSPLGVRVKYVDVVVYYKEVQIDISQ